MEALFIQTLPSNNNYDIVKKAKTRKSTSCVTEITNAHIKSKSSNIGMLHLLEPCQYQHPKRYGMSNIDYACRILSSSAC